MHILITINKGEGMIKPQIIIFDGVDKVGKTTLKTMFDKHMDFFHWTIDRGPLSHMVYNISYRRNGQNLFIGNVTKVCRNAILIYVKADEETVKERILRAGEKLVDLKRDMRLFDTVFNATVHQWKGAISVDTTRATPEDSLKDILVKLQQIEEVMTK